MKFRRVISFTIFIIFVIIELSIFNNKFDLKKSFIDSDGEKTLVYYNDLSKKERTSIGIFNIKNEEKILNAKNEDYKEKILNLITENNAGDLPPYEGKTREDVENIYKDSNIKFFGDSNVEHFDFYDILDKDYFFNMTGKNINEQKELIDEKELAGIKNVVFFNGYNLDKYNSKEEYINAYIDISNKIKSIDSDISIYVCSLLPATEDIIMEDLDSPLPHNIYLGKEFDEALESYDFENIEYIDTKWIIKENYHKNDGVHMIKDFYEVLIPYVAYYVNLDNANVETKKKVPRDRIIDWEEDKEYVDPLYITEDKFIFDYDEEWDYYLSVCGEEAMDNLKNIIFIGDSHTDRLTRSLAPYLTIVAGAGKSIRRLEKIYSQAVVMGKKYLVFFISNNDVVEQTDIKEFENEFEYIHSILKYGNVEDVFLCSYFQNLVQFDRKGKRIVFTEDDYTDCLIRVCNRHNNFHYLDFTDIYNRKYISKDGHLNYVFNKKALRKVINEVYKVEKSKSGNKKDENLSIGDSENNDENDKANIIVEEEKNFKSIKFGKNKGKDIEWLIIDENKEEYLLLSKYILDARAYNVEDVDVDWEKSTLREYLNNEFYNIAFSNAEKKKIISDRLNNNVKKDVGLVEKSDTEDKVYLLSIADVEKYFYKTDGDNKFIKSLATKKQDDIDINIKVNENKNAWYFGNSAFWLRSEGLYSDDAAFVNYNGNVSTNGINVAYAEMGVRPVIRIKK